jgi:hypothetical protein
MAVSSSEFRKAKGYWLSLEVAQSDGSDQITIVTVTVEGINGSRSEGRRQDRVLYRLLIDVQDLSSLPEVWILTPPDQQIEHLNIWPADKKCPITGTNLPRICWGISDSAWRTVSSPERTLSHLLEVTRQVLGSVYPPSAAR